MDIWSVSKREEGMKVYELEREASGEKRREKPGWRQVLEVAREDQGISDSCVFKIRFSPV